MRNFNYKKLIDFKYDAEILSLIAGIYKEAGKQEIYLKGNTQEFDKLIEIAKIQSTEASNKIEGIVTTSTRIKQLCLKKTTPKNRDEEEIAGYRDCLNLIHENYNNIILTKNNILQLHKILYSHMNNPMAGKCKSVQNYIAANYPNGESKVLFTPLSPFETPDALDRLTIEYNLSIGNDNVEPLIAIPMFIHDFLCIHPFNDGNGRMSRLLTTLLLYQNGFYIAKYISLENIISKHKEEYYSSLYNSQIGWHEEKEDVTYFIKYLLGIILKAYNELNERYSLIENKVSANELVKNAVMSKIGKFTKQDIIELCPSLSLSSIEGGLRALKNTNQIKSEGSGKNTYYIRLI